MLRKLWLLFAQTVTIALALWFVVAALRPDPLAPATAPAAAIPAAEPVPAVVAAPALPPSSPTSYSQAARRAAPAVVSIMASKAPTRPRAPGEDPWFRHFFGNGRNAQPQQMGLGSGVIVSADGYLLTNNHVVEGASDIDVQLADGRQVSARLVGTDPETDLALLQIALNDLPAITLGDIRALQVGDVVLAMATPSTSARPSPPASSARSGATGWACRPSRTSSRPTRPSTRAIPAARWSMRRVS
jgi:serine protease DegQ